MSSWLGDDLGAEREFVSILELVESAGVLESVLSIRSFACFAFALSSPLAQQVPAQPGDP